MKEKLHIAEARWPSDGSAVIDLFRNYQTYAASLGYDLAFQGFEEEVKGLPGKYARPDGLLLIARYDTEVAGCIAYRRLEPGICEMKRLYVRPRFRGEQIGGSLCRELIREARLHEYRAMRLDTGESMRSARKLYQSLGFKPIAPYYDNPYGDMSYFELLLNGSP
jgi:putative acetyltransferase